MKIYHSLFLLMLIVSHIIPMVHPIPKKRLVPQQTLSTLEKYNIAPLLKSIMHLTDNLHDCMNEAEECIQIQEVVLTGDQKKLFTDTHELLIAIKNLAEQSPTNRISLESAITAIPSFSFAYLAFTAFDFPEVGEDCPDNDIVRVTTTKYVEKMLQILHNTPKN